MNKLHPRAIWLFYFSYVALWIISYITLFYVLFIILSDTNKNIGAVSLIFIVAILLLFLVVPYIWARLSYYFYRYELKDEGVHIEMGVITKKYVTIPYNRIQNIDIYRGILCRLLGLSDLQIQTAGGSLQVSGSGTFFGGGPEGRLPGLSHQDAEKLRDELIKRTKKSQKSEL